MTNLKKIVAKLNKVLFAALVSSAFFSSPVYAQDTSFPTPIEEEVDPTCHDSKLISGKLITDICWNCVLPIRVAGIPIGGSSNGVPDGATKKVMCMCEDNLGVPRVGLTTSLWEPARLIEFQRTPGCSSVLGGHRLFPGNRIFQGTHDQKYDTDDLTFTHYHYYAFPLLMMMDLFAGGSCNAGGYMDLDLMYLSELDPTWNNSSLAFFANPESAAVANPVALLACIPDAISSTAGQPIKELFWCAGSWGNVYPLSGFVSSSVGIIRSTSLFKTRVLAALHRRGMAWKTMGDEGLCGGEIYPMLPKTQYKYTITYPIAETKKAHVTGQSSMFWGANKVYPTQEDPIYTIFRWKDCCHTY